MLKQPIGTIFAHYHKVSASAKSSLNQLSYPASRSNVVIHPSLQLSVWGDYSPTAKAINPSKEYISKGEKIMKKLILIIMARVAVAGIFGTQALVGGLS